MAETLAGGDRRSTGKSREVADLVKRQPELAADLFNLMVDHESPVVRARAGHAFKTVAREKPEVVQPFTGELLKRAAVMEQWEIREAVCHTMPHLILSQKEVQRFFLVFSGYLDDRRSFVRTFAMQGLVDLVKLDRRLAPRVVPILMTLSLTGSAAMRARGRKLKKELEKMGLI